MEEQPAPGRFVGGYRLERLLGRGGMGAVWLAADPRLDRMVALKLLPESLSGDPHFRQRFIAESQRAASLDHPHIVPIFDADEADGELFIAMRYVAGTTLESLIAEGPLDPARGLGLLRGIADALDAAHAAGLVHRDVKPGNILVTRTPSGEHAYLADFGLVKRAGDASLTGSGQIVGSVGYVAPEQIEGRPVDARADVYSLGCVLYATLTGVSPYSRDTDMATLYAHVSAAIPHPSAIRPELAPLDPVIERAMAKDPAARFQSAGAVIAAATDALRSGTTRGFLFADLRGYTAFVDQQGDQAGAALLTRYRDLARRVFRNHEGAEIRTEGDSFYVVFPSASRAVSAALALVEEAARDAISESAVPISVGVGVHAGETADTAEGPVGSAVNTAARLCAAARPGEVLVSDTVRGLVRTSLPVAFEDRGRRTFKGLSESMRIWGVRREQGGASEAAVTSRVRLGPTLRRGVGLPTVLAGGAALVVLAIVAASLGFGRNAGSSSPTPLPSAVGNGLTSDPAASPVASPTGPAEWIAYTRRAAYVSGDLSCAMPDYAGSSIVGEIRLARPDGSDDHVLTPGAGFFEHQATWTPDGSSIVFRGSDATGREGLWSIAPSATKLARVISSDVTDTFPGRPVVSASDPPMLAWPGFNGEIWMANADGTAAHAIATGLLSVGSAPDKPVPVNYADLDWLPRSSRLALVVIDRPPADPSEDLPAGALYTVDVTGSNPTRIAGADGLAVAQARWSPDGSRVALTIRHGATTVIEVASSTLGTAAVPAVSIERATAQEVAGTGASANARDPAWSPDGSKLAFASDATGSFEIYTIDAAGGTPTQVTHTEATRASCAPSWGSTTTEVRAPQPTPSGGAPLPLARGWLPGGTYGTDRFDPAFKVTLPAGWQVWQSDVDDVWLRDFTRTDFLDLDIGRITVSYPQGCYNSPTELAPKSAHDLIAWLQKRKKLKVTQLKTTQVGGAPAIQVDVTGVSPGTCEPIPSRILLFDVANGSLFVRPGETIRLIAVDVRGTLVVVVPRAGPLDGNGMSDPKVIDTLVRPIIDTMEFAGGS